MTAVKALRRRGITAHRRSELGGAMAAARTSSLAFSLAVLASLAGPAWAQETGAEGDDAAAAAKAARDAELDALREEMEKTYLSIESDFLALKGAGSAERIRELAN